MAVLNALAALRFIPAHAGNTLIEASQSMIGTVHPRSRGEHGVPVRRTGRAHGSSPLTRGTRAVVNQPAGQLGSSPLTRGTRWEVHRQAVEQRFIPAHAGNTMTSRPHTTKRAVHPRSRGEHRTMRAALGITNGSSPLTRGTRRRRAVSLAAGRFIPAHAGNTAGDATTRGRVTVHPRSRGEHHRRTIHMQSAYGSSPLTRGTLQAAAQVFGGHRFIPAHAGNTAQ